MLSDLVDDNDVYDNNDNEKSGGAKKLVGLTSRAVKKTKKSRLQSTVEKDFDDDSSLFESFILDLGNNGIDIATFEGGAEIILGDIFEDDTGDEENLGDLYDDQDDDQNDNDDQDDDQNDDQDDDQDNDNRNDYENGENLMSLIDELNAPAKRQTEMHPTQQMYETSETHQIDLASLQEDCGCNA